MALLVNKRIILGVSGGIAAYKSAELVRRLRDAGADVRVVMTQASTQFVTPLTFQALSGNPVHTTLLDADAEAGMGHIELARWADAVLIAPASADIMARIAHGLADDLLTTLCLASAAPLAVAPAMNQQMWRNAATQANAALLQERGVHLFGPAEGEQACGDTGPGRMLEPSELVESLAALFFPPLLPGVNIVVTAGPTVEDIDPVRYISNRSSGKMGYAIAAAAAEAGAEVTLVSGPTALPEPPRVQRVDVRSAREMQQVVMASIGQCHLFIATAAVADYRPATVAGQKIKKSTTPLELALEPNPDILAQVSALPQRPFCVGFAAETDKIEEYARSKLVAKGLDMIAANQVGISGQGFDSDKNALQVFWGDGSEQLPLASKTQLARQLVALIAKRYQQEKN